MTSLSRRAFNRSMVHFTTGAAATSVVPDLVQSGVAHAFQSGGTANGNTDALASLTLADVSAQIRARTVTSTQLVNACLARIDVYAPKLNAFITVMRDQALARAKALDEEQRAGKL